MENNNIKNILKDIISKYSPNSSNVDDEPLKKEFEMDSMQILLMLFDIEKEFKIQIDMSRLFPNLSLNDLTVLIEELIKAR